MGRRGSGVDRPARSAGDALKQVAIRSAASGAPVFESVAAGSARRVDEQILLHGQSPFFHCRDFSRRTRGDHVHRVLGQTRGDNDEKKKEDKSHELRLGWMARAWQGRSPGLPLSGRGASCHVSTRVMTPISTLPLERNTLPPFRLIAVAFAIVYVGYGLNFLAVKIAVETLPAFLFAGSHVLLAGFIMMGWRLARGGSLALPRGA